MLKYYITVLVLAFGLNVPLVAQVASIDSVLYQNQEITLVYTISDSLSDFWYKVDLYGLFGSDTLSLEDGRNYPNDSLSAGTYRMRWDPIRALGRYRGKARFLIVATPGFRVTEGPTSSYKPGQSVTLSWYGGRTIDDQFDIELRQFGNRIQTEEIQYGLQSYDFQLSEDLKPGEGYTLALSSRLRGISWESSPFVLNRIQQRKWYLFAFPAALVAGLGTWLLFNGPLDEPELLPE